MSMETQNQIDFNIESNIIPSREGTLIKTQIPLHKINRIHGHFNSIVSDLCNGQLSDDGKQGVAFFAEFLKDLHLNDLQSTRGVLGIN